jgi:hypothetical protein
VLKIVIEEELGFGVDLVPDGLTEGLASELDGVDDIYRALSIGQVHIYPEAPLARNLEAYAWCPAKLASVRGRNGLQVWLSEDQERYHKYVSSLGTVRVRGR